jgi:hypothetical protein
MRRLAVLLVVLPACAFQPSATREEARARRAAGIGLVALGAGLALASLAFALDDRPSSPCDEGLAGCIGSSISDGVRQLAVGVVGTSAGAGVATGGAVIWVREDRALDRLDAALRAAPAR